MMRSGFRIGLFVVAMLVFGAQGAMARSAMSPRHSGTEPPGGPRQLNALPGQSPGRTAEGGMGYTDAYGNTLTDKIPEEKVRRRARQAERPPATLPDVSTGDPVWTFK